MDSGVQRLQALGRHFQAAHTLKDVIKVTVTGAAGNIGYVLVHMIGQGRLLGPYQPISLTLVELPFAQQQLEGTLMELKDCALPLLKEIHGTTDYKEGFKGAQIAILVGAKPRGPGMERNDLLGQNAVIFRDQGRALQEYADKNVKVLVVGNPANTNALLCSHFAPNIPRGNFTALTRLDQNRSVSMLSDKLNVPVEAINNIIIWGNHSATQFADLAHGTVEIKPGQVQPLKTAIANDDWVQNEFTKLVAKRGAAIIDKRKLSSAASAANAICDHVHDWIIGTQPGKLASVAVITDGSLYGVPADLCFSFPTTSKDGKITVYQGLPWDDFSRKMVDITLKELLEERQLAFDYLKSKE